ncbi:hypothetical protein [Streptomyces sp. NPDC054794]
MVAMGAAVGAMASQRSKELIEDGARQALETREKLLQAPRGRVPRIRDIEDLIAIGVHPSAPAGSARTVTARVTPFVRRDQSAEIEAALRTHSFVLVVGESTAGKTRAAFEAARAVLPQHTFIAPAPTDQTSLRTAIATLRAHRRAVVWLDDIERYLGVHGLTPYTLNGITRSGTGREVVVLGTIRAQERARYSGVHDAMTEEGSRFDQRTGRDVLAQAHEIRLDRRWKPNEVERARVFTNDERLVHAVRSAGQYGIAEFLAAGPQLLTAWKDAWAPEGGHVRGAALVAAAVDARRAGWVRPLPTALLRVLHERYLAARGGPSLRPESWEAAMEWATTPLHATSSLLIPLDASGTAHYVFDYLPDATDASPDNVPIWADIWELLIAEADPDTCEAIGWEAIRRTRHTTARDAFRKAVDAGAITASAGLARVFGDMRQLQQACQVLRTALQSAPTDTDHDTLLYLRWALAWWSGGAGNTAEALALTTAIHEEYRRRYGDDDRETIDTGLAVGRWIGAAGRTDEALGRAFEAQQRSLRVFGPDDRTTLGCRFEVAVWTRESGEMLEAVRLWGELHEDASRVLGVHDHLTNDARWNLVGTAADAGDTGLALRLLPGVIEGRAIRLGADHPWTLTCRLELAGRTGRSGQVGEALTLAAGATVDILRALGEDHELTLAGLHQQALWTACSGEPERAREQFGSLLGTCEQRLGPNHPLTENCRTQLTQPGQVIWYYELPSW